MHYSARIKTMWKFKSMRKLVYTFFFSLLLCVQGCYHDNSLIFNRKISLKGKEIKSNQLLDPIDLLVYDTLLFVKEPLRGDKCLKILSLIDYNLISEAVFIGRGAGELTNPGPIAICKKNDVLWISDWGKSVCFKFPIDSIIANLQYRPNETFKIKTKLLPMMNVFTHASGNLGFSCYSLQENLVSFIDLQGELVDNMAIPNTVFPYIWDNCNLSDHPILLHYNHSKKRTVVAARYENKIAVIDDQGNISFKLETPLKKMKMNTRKTAWQGKYSTFYSIDSDKNFIYCLYRGGYAAGWDKSSKFPVNIYPSRLLVFDWNGVRKCELELDHEIIFSVLDENRNCFIGSSETAINGLVMYDLSFLNNSIQ